MSAFFYLSFPFHLCCCFLSYKKMLITEVSYGMGNLHSVGRELNLLERQDTINPLDKMPHALPKLKAEIFKKPEGQSRSTTMLPDEV